MISQQTTIHTQNPAKPTFTPVISGLLQRCTATTECDECRKQREGTLQRTGINSSPMYDVPPIVHEVLHSTGQSLDAITRSFIEPRFGHEFSHTPIFPALPSRPAGRLTIGPEQDGFEQQAQAVAEGINRQSSPAQMPAFDFSQVRIHADARAAESARAVNALAYTVGQDVVFGQGQYAPHSPAGQRLIAHELTHVLQQSGPLSAGVIQRDGMGDVRLAEGNATLIDEIRATAAYKALDAAGKTLADEIITEIRKRTLAEQNILLIKLKTLFDTPVKPPAQISTETKSSTETAAATEKVRVAKPAAAKNTGIEEKAAKDAARVWVGIKGKFGGGTYYVDRTSPTNIVVRAEILLKKAGTGSDDDIKNIKSMEDGIEKAASTKGYLVDITFVDVKGPDTFEVDVDPSKWELATNWSGGDPVGFAHELHHMFAFELDRYNYIDAHSTNTSMEISERLKWFRKELSKPANFNDPTSIMDAATHPNDSDVCIVSGLDMKTCMDARAKAAAKK